MTETKKGPPSDRTGFNLDPNDKRLRILVFPPNEGG